MKTQNNLNTVFAAENWSKLAIFSGVPALLQGHLILQPTGLFAAVGMPPVSLHAYPVAAYAGYPPPTGGLPTTSQSPLDLTLKHPKNDENCHVNGNKSRKRKRDANATMIPPKSDSPPIKMRIKLAANSIDSVAKLVADDLLDDKDGNYYLKATPIAPESTSLKPDVKPVPKRVVVKENQHKRKSRPNDKVISASWKPVGKAVHKLVYLTVRTSCV